MVEHREQRHLVGDVTLHRCVDELTSCGRQAHEHSPPVAGIGAAFDQPARFDVGRSPNKHVAFGGGPHFCLGAHLSRIEGALAFERIVERLPRLVLDVEPSAIRWRTGALHGLTALPVRAE